MKVIGLIGTGHMGSAILRAADRSGEDVRFLLADARKEAAEALAATLLSPAETADNETVIRRSDLVFLAVKPQNMKELMTSLGASIQENGRLTLVSMAAGTTTDSILGWAGVSAPIIRIMPNTPIDVGRGSIAYTAVGTRPEDVALFQALLGGSALLLPVREEKLDAVCALSGCGPAYVYLFIRALAEGGEKLGLNAEESLKLAAKTVEGAAGMVLNQKGDPTSLKNAVCSPGGATVEGVKVLETRAFEAIVGEALEASYRRTLELK